MAKLGLSADEVLSTTRAVRKRLDFERPVSMEVIHECLELALQAPTGSNAQGWHFVVVTDAEKRGKIAELYKQTFQAYRDMPNAADKLHARRAQVLGQIFFLAGREIVQHTDAAIFERVDEMRADKAGAAGDQNLFSG